MNATPRIRLCSSPSLPFHWVAENLDTGEAFIVAPTQRGWEKRGPYRGYRTNLEPVPGYCFMGTDIPLRREWSEVCRDMTGMN